MKHIFKRHMLSALALAMVAGLSLSACAGQPTSTSPSPSGTQAQTRIVNDKDGNPVEIPMDVERVAPQIGAMAQMTAMLGYSDRIVCAAVQNLNDYFKQIFPQYVAANPEDLSTANVEDIIKSKAQVVYGPVRDEATIAQLNAAGIAVVPLNTFSTVQEMKDNINKIAEILGGDAPQKAQRFCEYYQGNINKVTEATKGIQEADRVKIMSLNNNAGALGTVNKTDICSVYMQAAGGINVAADAEAPNSISVENVVEWNPDVIITMTASSQKAIMEEKALQGVNAVKNGKVFIVPYGTYMWSVRSGEGAMMPLWLATIMYPDTFQDIDMQQVVKDFFREFYAYDIPEAEIKTVLAGNQK